MINWLLPFLAGTLSGTVAAMGLGGGFVLFLYLTLFTGLDFLQCQILNLLFFLPCALLAALKNRGYAPCAFKCGPDYIDLWMGTQWVKWCFGAILIPLGLKELFHRKQETGKKENQKALHSK